MKQPNFKKTKKLAFTLEKHLALVEIDVVQEKSCTKMNVTHLVCILFVGKLFFNYSLIRY